MSRLLYNRKTVIGQLYLYFFVYFKTASAQRLRACFCLYWLYLRWNLPIRSASCTSCPIRKANPYRRMAKALKTSNIADNLLCREFKAYGPQMVLLTGISCFPYHRIFAYPSTILDAFAKQILTYVLSPSLKINFVLDTVNLLIKNHGISLHAETIIHSDQGCHYISHNFIKILYERKLRQSMSRRGNCWDNNAPFTASLAVNTTE